MGCVCAALCPASDEQAGSCVLGACMLPSAPVLQPALPLVPVPGPMPMAVVVYEWRVIQACMQ